MTAPGWGGWRRAAVASLVLVAGLWTAPALRALPVDGQLEVHAAERAEALARLEVEEVPLRRHLLARQWLAIWLPEGWHEQAAGGGERATFETGGGRRLVISRFEALPGAALVPILEEVLDAARSDGRFETVDSVRRLELAGREAIEVAGSAVADDGDGGDLAQRLVVAMSPDHSHYRTALLEGEADREALDRELKRLLRDWTPLDGGAWSPALERRRQALLANGPSAAGEEITGDRWAERNRLFAVLSRPEAIGQEWIDGRLRELAAAEPRLLLDGLFHHHPRVRIACLEALDPSTIDEPMRTAFYTAAMNDSDAAVRFRAARALSGTRLRAPDDPPDQAPDLAAVVLGRLLETDTEEARGAAFQLLAATPGPLRARLLEGAFAERRQFPEASQVLLATVLRPWGPEGEAEGRLRSVWKRSRLPDLRRAAWRELARAGDPEALAVARERLEEPEADGPVPLAAAATWSAVHANLDGGGAPWTDLAASLEAKQKDEEDEADETEGVATDDLEAARETLKELASYLESRSEEEADATDECAALDALVDAGSWAAHRRDRLGCTVEPPRVVVRASIPRPGQTAFDLLDLLERLRVGSDVQDQIFHAVLQKLDRRIDRWAGDPVTTASTGVDLEAPWDFSWWVGADRGDRTGSGSRPGGASWRLSSEDPDRFLDTLIRASSGPVDLERLTQGVFSSHAMALVPVTLAALWTEEQKVRTGVDDGSSTPGETETYVALGPVATSAAGPDEAGDSGEWVVHRLTLGDEEPSWRRTRLHREESRVTLTDVDDASLVGAGGPEPSDRQAGEAASAARIEVDLATIVERLSEEGEVSDELSEAATPGLSFSAGTALEPEAIATTFELGGLSPEWLAVAAGAGPEGFRAPDELLPERCLAWVGLHLGTEELAARFRELSPEALEDVPPKTRRRALAMIEQMDGEAGLALVGVPDPSAEDPGQAWLDRTVAFVAIDPAAGERFLKRSSEDRERHGDRRVYRWDDVYGTQVGRFLVFGTDPEVFSELGRAPFLSGSPAYGRMVGRAPDDAVLLAGWNTDLLADGIEESLGSREGGEESAFAVELFRSLGSVSGWLSRREGALVGELSTSPRFQSEAERERVVRRAAYGDLAWGSVRARGLPARAVDEIEPAALEATLRLPGEVPDGALDWANERLDQEEAGPGRYRFVSRIGTSLPEESDLELPITGPELRPYARNEQNLDLDSDEIRTLAETIRGEETDPAKIVRKIVDWAHEELDYTVVPEAVSTERVLATRQADCTEYSQLTIALARSLGIPARAVSGVVLAGDAAYFHRWAEVYLDHWYEVDPTWGVVQVPATHLRVPGDDSRFIATLPGARFTVEAIEDGVGGWARRLPGGLPERTEEADGERAEIAVDGERVLIAWVAADGGTRATDRRAVVSEDGGGTFQAVAAPESGGRLTRLLGGHGRILWLQAANRSGGRPVAYELDADERWRMIPLSADLDGAEGWSFGLRPEGYLALASDASRLVVLDRDLGSPRSVSLPTDGAGEWLLAREGGVLAWTDGAEGKLGGITLYRWSVDGWAPPVAIDDSADFTAVAVRRSEDRTEVVARQDPSGQLMRLVVADGSPTRRSASAAEAAAVAATTRSRDALWSVWSDGGGAVLVRRPLDGEAHEAPADDR